MHGMNTEGVKTCKCKPCGLQLMAHFHLEYRCDRSLVTDFGSNCVLVLARPSQVDGFGLPVRSAATKVMILPYQLYSVLMTFVRKGSLDRVSGRSNVMVGWSPKRFMPAMESDGFPKWAT